MQERTKEHKSGRICGPVYGCRDAHASRRAFSNVAIVINNNTVLLLLLLVSQRETWRRTKRSWCLLHLIWCSNHEGYGCIDINRSKEQPGEFSHLIKELKSYEDRFYGYFRMSSAQFNDLLSIIGGRIQKRTTNYRQSIWNEATLQKSTWWTWGWRQSVSKLMHLCVMPQYDEQDQYTICKK